MLSLLKKKPEAATVSEMPPWHPNLRNFARLPDTKVIRTAFFINGASVFIALGLLLWFSYQEYKLHNLERQIAAWDQQINRDKKDSDQFVALYAKFQGEQARVREVTEFLKSKPAVSQLLMHLADTLPKDIALDAYEQQALGLTVRGTVRGTPDEASGYASAYLDQLRADKVLAADFDDFAFSGAGVSRDPQTHRLSLQLYLRFRVASKGAKK
jgi:Tfp pilus assembly protein PilN